MQTQAQNKRHKAALVRWLVLLPMTVVFLLLAYVIVTQLEKRDVKVNAASSITAMKTACQNYDNYRLGMSTEDLQTVINKATILSIYTRDVDLSQETVLLRYAKNQYLTGIFVLSQALRVEGSANLDGRNTDALLAQILSDGQAQSILEHREKVYAGHAAADGRSYDYAILARQDVEGLIVCYTDTTQIQADKYELSLSTLLSLDVAEHDAVMVVTDGETVIASNQNRLQGLAVEACPITNVVSSDELKNDRELIQLRDESGSWYGMHDLYRSYYLYVFFPERVVFSGRLGWLVVIAGAYAIVCLLVALGLQRRKKQKLMQMEKEYHLLNAVSSIYIANLLIHLENNRWEALIRLPSLMRLISDIGSADEMLEEMRRSFVAASDRAEFSNRVELRTMAERLYGRRFLGYTFEGIDGQWYQMLLVPQSHNRDDEVTAVMLLLRNVSEQKRTEMEYQERLRQSAEASAYANAAKTDFLRRMSHDIRTPINGIRGMADMGLTLLDAPEKEKQCLDKIMAASDVLLELVNDVLDMSKLEAGEDELEQTSFNLHDVMRRTLAMVETQAKAAGVDVTCEVPQVTHWALIGGKLGLERVLQNILSNAVKYNHRGGSVRVSCRETAFDGETAELTFVCADTGIGMSEEFQKHAFESFAQEHSSARTTYAGTGLGLSIAKKTVEQMGGTITFVSRLGEGTTFTIVLPLRVDAQRAQPQTDAPEEVRLDGVKILMAEDNALNLEIGTYMLTQLGASVTAVENGQQALDAYTAAAPGSFDVILLDIMMPVMDGLTAARAIRALARPDAAEIPIIAVSANAFADDIAASHAAGCTEHLPKPLDFPLLARSIRKYCPKR